ncbi:Proteasome subunit beta type-4 [Camellia lanceoleosa]|uniref:Proteasome subunit beta type-4 n=1 Tax=Camellia lanceoleosa TaxID=1840588 RepID=A0ACC0HIQ6_9ERIC|nr:Proteasome subunit beta type-4 [Camellia lanceoleosa]
MNLNKGQLLETKQMFRDTGEQWPVIIPEEEIRQAALEKVLSEGTVFKDLTITVHGLVSALEYYPYVTGTSVIGIKFKDGILMAADMGGSYGSTLRYKSVERLKSVRKHSPCLYHNMWDDGNLVGPKEVHNYLTRMMYNRRNKFNPLWNSLVLGGVKNGQKYLGTVVASGVDERMLKREGVCAASLPTTMRGASSNRFLNYLNKNIVPVFDKFVKESGSNLEVRLNLERTGDTIVESSLFSAIMLRTIDDLTKAMVKKLNQGMTEHNKAMAATKTAG